MESHSTTTLEDNPVLWSTLREEAHLETHPGGSDLSEAAVNYRTPWGSNTLMHAQ